MTGKPDQRIAVVTGSSSGMGFETSLALARNEIHTYATVRKVDGGGGLSTDTVFSVPTKITHIATDSASPHYVHQNTYLVLGMRAWVYNTSYGYDFFLYTTNGF